MHDAWTSGVAGGVCLIALYDVFGDLVVEQEHREHARHARFSVLTLPHARLDGLRRTPRRVVRQQSASDTSATTPYAEIAWLQPYRTDCYDQVRPSEATLRHCSKSSWPRPTARCNGPGPRCASITLPDGSTGRGQPGRATRNAVASAVHAGPRRSRNHVAWWRPLLDPRWRLPPRIRGGDGCDASAGTDVRSFLLCRSILVRSYSSHLWPQSHRRRRF